MHSVYIVCTDIVCLCIHMCVCVSSNNKEKEAISLEMYLGGVGRIAYGGYRGEAERRWCNYVLIKNDFLKMSAKRRVLYNCVHCLGVLGIMVSVM